MQKETTLAEEFENDDKGLQEAPKKKRNEPPPNMKEDTAGMLVEEFVRWWPLFEKAAREGDGASIVLKVEVIPDESNLELKVSSRIASKGTAWTRPCRFVNGQLKLFAEA